MVAWVFGFMIPRALQDSTRRWHSVEVMCGTVGDGFFVASWELGGAFMALGMVGWWSDSVRQMRQGPGLVPVGDEPQDRRLRQRIAPKGAV
jgi:hypothetical protein